MQELQVLVQPQDQQVQMVVQELPVQVVYLHYQVLQAQQVQTDLQAQPVKVV